MASSALAIGMPVREDAVVCVVCHERGMRLTVEGVRDYVTGDTFSLRQCDACGVVLTVPQPDASERFYPARYRRYNRLVATVERWLYRRRVRGWSYRLGPPGTLLEVGCGDGWMLRALQERGWSVIGSERSVESAAFAARQQGLPVFVGGPEALRSSSRLQVLVLFHVLEHLADPVAALARYAALLQSGGVLIVAVPNRESWQARWCGPAWFHLDVPRHLCHFSPRALTLALEQAGLRVERRSTVSWEHDPYGWVQSWLNLMGFEQNLLTRRLMGLPEARASAVTWVTMMVAGAVLVVPGLLLSVASWLAGAGAVMEVWARTP